MMAVAQRRGQLQQEMCIRDRDRTIYRVLAHARCPVLTLREPRANLDAEGREAGSGFIWSEGNKEETRQ